MGNLVRMAVPVLLEKNDEFQNYSGPIYMFWFRSQDNAKELPIIIVNTTSLNTANFDTYDNGDEVPLGAVLINLNDGAWYIRQYDTATSSNKWMKVTTA